MSRLQRGSREAEEKPRQSVGYSGRAGLERFAQEETAIHQRQNSPRMPFRFRTDFGPNAEPSPIIFLDDSLDNAFFMYEHGVQNEQGKWGNKVEVCVKERDNCPLCTVADGSKTARVQKSTYVMFLTVLDLRPYKNKDGVTVTHSKKLFAVRGLAIREWTKLLQRVEERYKTLRGVYMEVGRNDKSEGSTGKPLLLDNDMLFDHIKERELEDDYGHDAVLGDNKQVVKPADYDITPFNYEELFPYPDVDALARQYGVRSGRAGSRAEVDEEWDRPADQAPATSGRRSVGASRRADEEDVPARGRARSATRGRQAQEELPDVENQEADDTPPPPRRTRQEEAEPEAPRSRRAAPQAEEEPKASSGRRTRQAVEEDVEAETPPTRVSSRSRGRVAEEKEEAPASRRPRAAASRTRPAAPASGDEEEVW